MWLLDTDTCSYIFRRHPSGVADRFDRTSPGDIGLSSIVLAELCFGVARRPNADQLRADIREFRESLLFLPWDADAADHYGDIRAYLKRRGLLIGSMDLMIAAHARSLDATLVTNNVKHLRRVPGLRLENWI